MARPAAYQDSQRYNEDPFNNPTFDLPLFNPHPPQPQSSGAQSSPNLPPIHTDSNHHQSSSNHHRQNQYSSHLPPPSVGSGGFGGHQQRHSVGYIPTTAGPPIGGNSYDLTLNSPHSPQFPVPATGPGGPSAASMAHNRQQSMSSALPYTSPYGSHAAQQELMPPPATASSSFSLGRSASLGTRRKDPYTYSSDDVESGLGNMDMGNDSSWQGYDQQGRDRQVHSNQVQGYGSRDVIMSPTRPSPNSQMNPPPIPAPTLNFPSPRLNDDSGGSSPSRGRYNSSGGSGHHSRASTSSNPYIPRGSESGTSTTTGGGGQWTDYRRPPTGGRMTSTSSFDYPSPGPQQLSPYLKPENYPPSSPQSPLMNPYDVSANSPTTARLPTSPRGSTNAWPDAQMQSIPTSPPVPQRVNSSQTYPASQPVTPASRGPYDMGPPRGLPTRAKTGGGATSRTGLREVTDLKDLKPVLNAHSAGRRADPDQPGKYLSSLKCLTSALPQTYTLCNPSFRYESSDNPRRVLTKPSKPAHNDGADNEDWDYILYVNDVLGGDSGGDRYLILDVLGQGTFGQVVKCQNMRNHEIMAVKVVKNKPAYLNQSKMEVAILELLNTQWDPQDQHHILRMVEHFTHKNHLCLVFECLSSNLYELIKQNQFKGLSTQLVKVFTQQLLDCLSVLKDARLIHCDLKPENILLKSLQSPQIKVIDFGSACHEMATVYTYIQSRFYRSPEVLLGLPYSAAVDMWSLGTIVVELFLGLPLFPGTSEYNQISRIVDMLGNPPGHLLEVGKQTHEFFNYTGVDAFGKKQYVLKSMEQYASEHRTKESPSKQYFKQTKLRDIIMEYPYAKKNPKQSDIDKEMANRRAFVDFVQGLLNLDPIQRWSPQQAVKHPFITGEKFTEPFQPPLLPSRKNSVPTPNPETPAAQPTTPSSKKYGGLVQTPPSSRGQRVYSDAAAYNQQLSHHQSYTAQVQAANAVRHQPFSPGYDLAQSSNASPYAPRVASQSYPTQTQSQDRTANWQMPPPAQQPQPQPQQQSNFGHRVASQGMPTSASHNSLRMNAPAISAQTNPPPNSYYPSTRNRANTINRQDAIPPALARLAHFGVPDPSGTRNLTPVMNRDDAIREWERRHSGHSKQSSLTTTSYPQLEYLQEQAELAAMGGSQGWGIPGSYGPGAPGPSAGGKGMHGHGHRASLSMGGGHAHSHSHSLSHSHSHSMSGQGYQMQPGIGPQASPGGGGMMGDYRREYESPSQAAGSSSARQSYLPAFPPPAAVTSSPHLGGGFDAFDNRDPNMGMMYTPLQPTQYQGAYGTGNGNGNGNGSGNGGGHHSQRSSYSGPYHNGGQANTNNPFAPPSSQAGGGQGQVPTSPRDVRDPRYQRKGGGGGGYGA